MTDVNTTPNGTVVEFQAEPKRFYKVNDVEVPSVTSVLDVLHRPALIWWGQGIACAGILELIDRGCLMWVDDE